MKPTAPADFDPFRARVYRAVLILAAGYNFAFGMWAGFWPRAFFDVFGLAAPQHPAIWRCLGMVVGVYGLLYGYAALRLDRAWPIVAVGLLGKVLGPIGLAVTIQSGEWPLRAFSLIVFNDLIWWLPFSLFLIEGTRLGERVRAAAPFACAAINGLAGVILAVGLRPGTEAGGGFAERAAFIGANPLLWRGGWLVWMAAALSLQGFYAWWGARLGRPRLALAALGLSAAGLVCDLFAESLFIAWLPAGIETLQPLGTLLTSGAANALYTAGGVVLTLATPWRSAAMRALAWVAWLAGAVLTLSALAGSVAGMAVGGAGLMALFCPLAFWMGLDRSWRRA
jgi:hypothetical protein